MSRSVTHDQVEEIRRRTDIAEVIGARITLKRAGAAFKACCPFHHEKTPSFTVNPSRQTYKCFGCGKGGDVFSFLQEHDGMTFSDALKHLAERCGVVLKFGEDDGQGAVRKRLLQLHEELAAFYHKTLLDWKGAETARAYVTSRDLPPAIVETFRIGFAPPGPDVMVQWARAKKFTLDEMTMGGVLSQVERYGRPAFHDRFRGRLMFPICDTQGRVVAFSGRLLEKDAKAAKYVNSPETPIFSKGRILYALDKAQRSIVSAPGRQALVCEGQIDVLRCHASGFTTAVASQGTAFTAEHVTLLKRYADSVVLVFDSDGAGQKASIATARIFLAAGIPARIARLPEGADPDDFLRNNPPDAFQALLDGAEEIVPFQIRHLRAREKHPDAADAAGRITDELLVTLLQCSNAVHQARMLQEGARLLALPEGALSEQLEKLKANEAEREAKRATSEAAYAKLREEQAVRDHAQIAAESILLPVEEDIPDDGIETSGMSPDSATLRKMRPEEFAVCLMLNHALDDGERDLIAFLDTWLPLALFQHPHSRLFAGAIFEEARSGKEAVADLQATATPDVLEFVRSVAIAPARAGKGEFSPMEAAKDVVTAFWKRRLEQERAEVRGDDAVDVERQRLRITMDLQKMRNWDTTHDVIHKARERLAGCKN